MGKRPIGLATFAVLAVAAVIGASVVLAAAGDLDPSFGGTGTVTTGFEPGRGEAHAVAVQADGKIVAAGTDSSDFALARYTSDGSLDTSFGGDGKVTTSVGIINLDVVNDIAIQADGRIVAAGTIGGQDFALVRYNPDGGLDTSFGAGGIVTTDFPSSQPYDQAFAVALQADGKIVAAGGTAGFGFRFALARYNPDGSLDTSFDGDGRVTTDFNSFAFDVASALAIQADGKIVAAGRGGLGSGIEDFALARYNSDGSLDTSFGTAGKTTTDFGGGSISPVCMGDRANDIAIQSDGKIVAGGVTGFAAACGGSALARYNSDGSLDTSFGSAGTVTRTQEGLNALALQPDGKLLALGTGTLSGICCAFVLGRYLPDGTPDPSFGQNGQAARTPLGDGLDLALQADGKIVAAGATGLAFGLARYLTDLQDTTPPTITVPPSVSIAATGEAGATVTYTATASDNSDPNPTLSCVPPSGTIFPIGDTTVDCEATDEAGNHATASFVVHVKGAQEQIDDLLELVDTDDLGRGTSLHATLVHVSAALEADNTRAACNGLNAVLAIVNAQTGKSLSAEQADQLTGDVLRIKSVIGC